MRWGVCMLLFECSTDMLFSFFFFKQKTAYEVRISDWSSDVCSSDLQGLADLATWVEKGIPPAETSYSFSDGKVSLPAGAAERGGTQPVVRVTAEGKACLEESVGQHVMLRVEAEEIGRASGRERVGE